jgi:hypothetical protein
MLQYIVTHDITFEEEMLNQDLIDVVNIARWEYGVRHIVGRTGLRLLLLPQLPGGSAILGHPDNMAVNEEKDFSEFIVLWFDVKYSHWNS